MFSERVQNYGTEPWYLNNAAAGETKKEMWSMTSRSPVYAMKA